MASTALHELLLPWYSGDARSQASIVWNQFTLSQHGDFYDDMQSSNTNR